MDPVRLRPALGRSEKAGRSAACRARSGGGSVHCRAQCAYAGSGHQSVRSGESDREPARGKSAMKLAAKWTTICCATAVLFALAVATQAQEQKSKGINPVTVTAYQKLGGEYGGLEKGEFRIYFQAGQTAAEQGLPGFRFTGDPPEKLPDVGVPICLEFSGPVGALGKLDRAKVTDAGLKQLAGLKNLSALYLASTKVTDAGLRELTGLENLSTLDLSGTKVTDAGLKALAPLKNLSALYLVHNEVTDVGLRELVGLAKLSVLHLSFTKVTDAGMKELAKLKNLTELQLSFTKVTDAGLKELAWLTNL